MFIYLSKKIAIPNNIKLHSLSWNKESNFIACGGEEGLLKVLKLDPQSDDKVKGLAAPSNLTMNQSLEGHNGVVQVIAWNENCQKLTTSDQNGLIIVWMYYKGSWFEEMINNSTKSVVRGMKWNAEGQKICIAYEDGSVIVGSVDGNRIWGKDLKGLQLRDVEWSPDSKIILFAINGGQVHVYDSIGNPISTVELPCLKNSKSGTPILASMEWYKGQYGYMSEDCPCLAICFTNGRCQIMRNEKDTKPILLDTELAIQSCCWNKDGTILAIAGLQPPEGDEKEVNVVHFYTPFGEHMRTLKVPGKDLKSVSWDADSLRVALAVDSFIYFANIRPEYLWCYCGPDTLVYAYMLKGKGDYRVIFWNTKLNKRQLKYVRYLKGICGSGDYCCLAYRDGPQSSKYTVQLCNDMGTPMDSKIVDFTPQFMAMRRNHVILADHHVFFYWHFRDPRGIASLEVAGKRKAGGQKLVHIDQPPTEKESSTLDDTIDWSVLKKKTKDPICCLAVSETMLFVGCESGRLQQYALPYLQLTHTFYLQTRPYKIEINSDSTRIAIINMAGVLSFLDHEKGKDKSEKGGFVDFERKDVWSMKFAEDNPDLFVMIEKTKLTIFRGLEAEEPINSSAYICEFRNLQVRAALLDDIVRSQDDPQLSNVLHIDVKVIRDAKKILERDGLEVLQSFVEENPHPRLWRFLAEEALQRLNLQVAEQSFVRYQHYPGIVFTQQLANLKTDQLRKAEVECYFGRYDEAEKMYLDLDRKELAIAMRKTLGDWYRVVQLIKGHGGENTVSDAEISAAWNRIGDHHFDRQQWTQASSYYQQSGNHIRQAECFVALEDYNGLEKLCEALPDDSPILMRIAETFVSVGMCTPAVYAYVKASHLKEAIDTCVHFNQWSTAVDLAKQHNMSEIDELLSKCVQQLLQNGRVVHAIELYRKAGRFIDAAKLMHKLAMEEVKKGGAIQKLKKMFVLTGLLIEQYHEQNKITAIAKMKMRKSTEAGSALAGLLQAEAGDVSDSRLVDQAWRGAEAYHFYLLAQRQLLSGMADAAKKTAQLLRDYDDLIPGEKIYSLIALCSAKSRHFATCSKALLKLETMEVLSESEKSAYDNLALEIFTRYPPNDPPKSKLEIDAEEMFEGDSKPPICIVTGQIIADYQFWVCPSCKHSAYESEIEKMRNCPLCHNPVM